MRDCLRWPAALCCRGMFVPARLGCSLILQGIQMLFLDYELLRFSKGMEGQLLGCWREEEGLNSWMSFQRRLRIGTCQFRQKVLLVKLDFSSEGAPLIMDLKLRKSSWTLEEEETKVTVSTCRYLLRQFMSLFSLPADPLESSFLLQPYESRHVHFRARPELHSQLALLSAFNVHTQIHLFHEVAVAREDSESGGREHGEGDDEVGECVESEGVEGEVAEEDPVGVKVHQLFHRLGKVSQQIIMFFLNFMLAAEAAIVSLTLSAAPPPQINVLSNYTLSISRLTNPQTSQTNSGLANLPADATIQIQFPSVFALGSTVNCVGIMSLTCSVSGQRVIVSGYFAGGSSNTINFVAQNIRNPSVSGKTAFFYYWIMQGSTVIDSGPNLPSGTFSPEPLITILPGSFSSPLIVSSPNTVLSPATLTFSLTTSNPIPQGGTLQLTVPSSWTLDLSGSQTCQLSSLVVSPVSNLDSTLAISSSYTQIILPFNNIIVLGSLKAGVLSGTFSFTLSSVLNPPVVNDPQLILIRSLTSAGNVIDSSSVPVSSLVPQPFSSFTLTPSSTEAGKQFSLDIKMVPNLGFKSGDTMSISLPTGVRVMSPSLAPSTSFASSSFSISSNTYSIFNIVNYIQVDFSQITISLYQLQNPPDTLPLPSLQLTLFRNSLPYHSSSASLSITPSLLSSVLLTPQLTVVNSVSTANLVFTVSNPIPVGGSVCIQYPTTMTVANQPASTCGTGSCMTVNRQLCVSGAFAVQTEGQVTLSLTNFQNPQSTMPTQVSVKTFKGSSVIDQGQASITATVGQISSLTVVSSSMKVASDTTITLTLSANLPYDKLVVSFTTQFGKGLQFSTPSCLRNSLNQQCSFLDNKLTMMAASSLPGSSVFSFTCKMPTSFAPVQISVMTWLAGYPVEVSSSISLAASVAQSLQSGSISTTSNVNSGTGKYSLPLQFKSFTGSPGVLSVDFPSQFSVSNPSCQLDQVAIVCTLSSNSIQISPVNIPQSMTLTLSIFGVINPSSTKPPSSLTVRYSQSGFSVLSQTLTPPTTVTASALTLILLGTGFMAEVNSLSLSLSTNGLQTYGLITIPGQFPEITTLDCTVSAPAQCSLYDSRTVKVLFATSSLSVFLKLVAPSSPSSSPFLAKTYTQGDFLVSKGESQGWTLVCNLPCRSCSLTVCLSCYIGALSNGAQTLYNGNCVNNCPAKFFLQASSCQPCSTSCATCITSSTNCLSCDSPKYLDSSSSTCVISCPAQTFGDVNNNKCTNCVFPCLTCTSLSSCLTCVDGRFFLNNQCLTTCPSNLYYMNTVTKACESCRSPCLTCSTSVATCLSCTNSFLLENNNCVSACSPNLFPKNGACSPCESPCLTCVTTTITCRSCDITSTKPYLKANQCVETCSGSFFVDSSFNCVSCPPLCTTCTSLTVCSGCVSGMLLHQNSCISSCPSYFFLTGSSCQACQSPCLTCSGVSSCLSCIANKYLNGQSCVPSCPVGTYTNNQVCIACPVKCSSCTSATSCQSCNSPYLLYNSDCLASCPTGSYSQSPDCVACPIECQACQSRSICTVCSNGFYLQANFCTSSCIKGVGSNGICYPCGLGCLNCQQSCTACSSGYFLSQGICITSCPVGQFGSGSICASCSGTFSNCKICSASGCSSCNSGQLYQGQCSNCPQGTFGEQGLCRNCPASCGTCTSLSVCTTCATGMLLEGTTCLSKCSQNRVASQGQCIICAQGCGVCDQESLKCKSCVGGQLLYKGVCTSNCPTGFQISWNGTTCLTQLQKSLEQQGSSVYFPFTISAIIAALLVLVAKFYSQNTKTLTALVAIFGLLEFFSWLVGAVVLGVNNSTAGCVVILLGCAVFAVVNAVSMVFIKKRVLQSRVMKDCKKTSVCGYYGVLAASCLSHQFFRILRSYLLDFPAFSYDLPLYRSLKNLQIIFLLVGVPLALAGSILGCYSSVAGSSPFLLSLDILVLTILLSIMEILDMRGGDEIILRVSSQEVGLEEMVEQEGQSAQERYGNTNNQLEVSVDDVFKGYQSVYIQGVKPLRERFLTEDKISQNSLGAVSLNRSFVAKQKSLREKREGSSQSEHKSLLRSLKQDKKQFSQDKQSLAGQNDIEPLSDSQLLRQAHIDPLSDSQLINQSHFQKRHSQVEDDPPNTPEQHSPQQPKSDSPIERKESESIDVSKIEDLQNNVSSSDINNIIQHIEGRIQNTGKVEVQEVSSKYDSVLPAICEESPQKPTRTNSQQESRPEEQCLFFQEIDSNLEDDALKQAEVEYETSQVQHPKSDSPYKIRLPPRARQSSQLQSRRIQVKNRRTRQIQTQTDPLDSQGLRIERVELEDEEDEEESAISADDLPQASLQFVLSPSAFNQMNQRYQEKPSQALTRASHPTSNNTIQPHHDSWEESVQEMNQGLGESRVVEPQENPFFSYESERMESLAVRPRDNKLEKIYLRR